jgi:hypothetical protein
MMSDFLENALRLHLFRTGSFAKPAALWVSLHTGDPAGGNEVVGGGGYARVQRDPADANWTGASPTDGITTNVADIAFPAPTTSWGTVTHFGLWDAATGGNLLVHGALTTPRVVNGGDSAPVFAAGALVVTFA